MQHVPAAMWQDSEDGDHEPAARTCDEEEGGVPASTASSASVIPERQYAQTAAAGRRSTALSLHSTFSSVSDSGAGDNGRVSFQQEPPPPPTPQRDESLSDSVPAEDRRPDLAGSLASFPSFHTTQALLPPEEEGAAGITVVDDVRTLGHVENHIVVLLPKAMDKIQYLLRPLRAQFLRGTPFCKSVVILTETSVGQLERHCRSLEVGLVGRCGVHPTNVRTISHAYTIHPKPRSPPPTRAAHTTPLRPCPSTSTWWRASRTRPGTSGGRASRRPTPASSWRTARRCRCVVGRRLLCVVESVKLSQPIADVAPPKNQTRPDRRSTRRPWTRP